MALSFELSVDGWNCLGAVKVLKSWECFGSCSTKDCELLAYLSAGLRGTSLASPGSRITPAGFPGRKLSSSSFFSSVIYSIKDCLVNLGCNQFIIFIFISP